MSMENLTMGGFVHGLPWTVHAGLYCLARLRRLQRILNTLNTPNISKMEAKLAKQITKFFADNHWKIYKKKDTHSFQSCH